MSCNHCSGIFGSAVALVVAAVLSVGAAAQAHSSQVKVLHSFDGASSDAYPYAGLALDAAGNLYGTTAGDSVHGHGSVFKLTPNPDGSWSESALYTFSGGVDGSGPLAGVTLDSAGNIFGTTYDGGLHRSGTIFKVDTAGTYSVLHHFNGTTEGGNPDGELVWDEVGNLYSTNINGGTYDGGAVFRLDPAGKLIALYNFKVGTDGYGAYAGLIRDAAGNLYGTAAYGGNCSYCGTVFRVDPTGQETLLYKFTGNADGCDPLASLTFDAAGNLYGTTNGCGAFGYGTAFKLDPNGKLTVLHGFTGGKDGSRPRGQLVFDASGNLHGTTSGGGHYGKGVVFKLMPNADGNWRAYVLHHFTGPDGNDPEAGLIIDAAGNLYGTTFLEGTGGGGVVFEIAAGTTK